MQNVSATGSTESHRVRLNLTLAVSRTLWSPSTSAASGDAGTSGGDAAASNGGTGGTATLSISGRVTSENPHVKMGAFHTLDLEANRDVRIEKDEWDSIAINRIDESCVPGRGAEVAAIVCGEGTKIFILH